MTRTNFLIMLAAYVLILLSTVPVIGADESPGWWEIVPIPENVTSVTVLGTDQQGSLWLVTDKGLFYLKDTFVKAPEDIQLKNYYFDGIFGGDGRRLCVSKQLDDGLNSQLYELSNGSVQQLTSYYRDPLMSRYGQSVYISKSGKLYNWGSRFLAVFSDGQWKREVVSFNILNVSVLEDGDDVYFISGDQLYCVDAEDNITKRADLQLPESFYRERVKTDAHLLGDTILLAFSGHKGIHTYNLHTGEPCKLESIGTMFDNTSIRAMISLPDGSIWVIISAAGANNLCLYHITTNECVAINAPFFAISSDKINERFLQASDGSIWFVFAGKVYQFLDGEWHEFDWRNGLNIGTMQGVWEDFEGGIYVRSGNNIYKFQPDKSPFGVNFGIRRWEEYNSKSMHSLICDGAGNIWMFLPSRLDQISCWDGNEWRHVYVPFNGHQIRSMITDDTGHLLITTSLELSYMQEYVCYDVSMEGVTSYPDAKTAMIAAAQRGATAFGDAIWSPKWPVLNGGHLVCYEQTDLTWKYYDGSTWSAITQGMSNANELFLSVGHEFIITRQSTTGYRSPFSEPYKDFYFEDRGQLVKMNVSQEGITRWLLSPNGLQPFEPGLLNLRNSWYIPVERDETGKLYFLNRLGGLESEDSLYTRADQIPNNKYQGFRIGRSDCFWLGNNRIIGGKIFPVNLAGTPFEGVPNAPGIIIEDRMHNLWVDCGNPYSPQNHQLLFRSLREFRLKLQDIPKKVVNSLQVRAESTLSGLDPNMLRLFWRLENGSWQGGELGGSTTIRFPSSGKHRVEIMGMEPFGGTTPENVVITVEAKVTPPDTKLTEKGPFIAQDLYWTAPVEVISTEANPKVEFICRVDEGEWKLIGTTARVPLIGLEPGKHVVELAAIEDGISRDLSPVRAEIDYIPDYELMVESRLDEILGKDENIAKAAMKELETVGPAIITILQAKIAEIQSWQQYIRRINQLINDIRYKQRS